MKYRKLRITFSAVCGVLCLLLIVLWVRSYWWSLSLTHFGSDDVITTVASHYGIVQVGYGESMVYEGTWNTLARDTWHTYQKKIGRQAAYRGFHTWERWGVKFICVPHWFLIGGMSALATSPWLRWRFSLRTLLIATTVVAVGLGLAIYAARN